MSNLTVLYLDILIKPHLPNNVTEWLEINNQTREDSLDEEFFLNHVPDELAEYESVHCLNSEVIESIEDYYSFNELALNNYRLTLRITGKNKDCGLEELVKFLIPFMEVEKSTVYMYYEGQQMLYDVNLEKSEECTVVGQLDTTLHQTSGDGGYG